MSTTTIRGKRLQVTCRALGIPFSESGKWVKRGGFSNFKVDGVKVNEADAQKLRDFLTAKAEKKRIARELAPLRRQRAQERAQREQQRIAASVAARWRIDPEEIARFAEHANERGSGRVIRAKSCGESFDDRVRMALVAWVRHQHTEYEAALRTAKEEAYDTYLRIRQDGDDAEYDDEESGETLHGREAIDAALQASRSASDASYPAIREHYTSKAVAWLEKRAIDNNPQPSETTHGHVPPTTVLPGIEHSRSNAEPARVIS